MRRIFFNAFARNIVIYFTSREALMRQKHHARNFQKVENYFLLSGVICVFNELVSNDFKAATGISKHIKRM